MSDYSFPLVVDIKRDSLEDGPGIRSVVFFKGCPLRCTFCHSPETQDPKIDIAFSEGKCLRCGRCADICPQGAIDLSNVQRINRGRCTRCSQCVGSCPGKALRKIGQFYPVDSLVEILVRDLPFYRHSGGGVTLSGGECTLYPKYIESLLRSLKARQIHIVLETCGYFNFDSFSRRILPYIDLIYYDVKIADPGAHKKHTGKTNEKILDNLRRLLLERPTVVCPRIPLIPDITATADNLSAIVNLLVGAGAENVSLLPYNPMGIEMAVNLGRPRPHLLERFMSPDEEKEIHDTFQMALKANPCADGNRSV
jgi:pyruvate formate lyase activating enzyme